MTARSFLLFRFLLALPLVVSAGFSQSYPFKQYVSNSGLVHSAVRVTFQDSRGFIWFGTQGGLNCYDGSEFTAFLSHGKDRSSIRALFEEADHTLLIGTYGNGLAALPPGDTTVIWADTWLPAPAQNVTAFYEDRLHNLWIGTDEGLMVRVPNGPGRVFRDDFKVSVGEIYGITRDRNDILWIAAHTGLWRVYVDSAWSLHADVVVKKPSRAVLLRRNGDLIVGTSGGGNDKFGIVCRVRQGVLDTIVSYRTAGRLIKGQALFEDAAGVLWVGTEYGIYMVRDNAVTHIGTRNGLQDENVYNITQDREGTMWFATEGGVIKLPTPWFLTYGMKDGLCGYVALSLCEDAHRDVWVGMYNGLARIPGDGAIRCWDETDGLLHHTVRSLVTDGRDVVWVSTPLGVNTVSQGRILPCPIPVLRKQTDAWDFCTDLDGGFWLGLRGMIVKVKNNTIVKSLGTAEGLTQEVSEPLCVDHSGRLWFTNGIRGAGIAVQDDVSFVTTDDGLPDNRVHCVFEDSDRRIWIGTESGLVRWSDAEKRAVPFPNAMLATTATYCVMEDSAEHLWCGTDHGVYEYTGTQLHQYTSQQGLPNEIVQSGFVSRSGEVWLGTHGGVARLLNVLKPIVVPVPTVYMKKILAGDGRVPITGGDEVAFDDRSLEFFFNSLSFVNESALLFQWRLEGFDRDWLPAQNQRQVRYTNLPAGQYVFRVRAANKNGEWSAPASIGFIIRPPYWQTWWFILLSLAVTGTIIYTVHRYRLAQFLKVERMRARIAADLHDDIASSLSSVALYSDVIQRQVSAVPADAQELLGRIRDLSRETMENIGLIVWSVDPRRDEAAEVIAFFQRHAVQMCTAAGLAFISAGMDIPRQVHLTPDQRRTIYLILKEALNNVIRHAGCSSVRFSCTLENRVFQLALMDDGKGFDVNSDVQGHGLQNMQSRAASIGAILRISSTAGDGTTLTLSLRIA